MPTYDFQQVVKYLDFGLVNQDTTINLKPLTVSKIRSVDKVRQHIVVPATGFNILAGASCPVIVGQFNYTMTAPFRITNSGYLMFGYLGNIAICVRFRIGNTAYRYLLAGLVENLASVPVPMYTNQRILPNFVIEVWANSPQNTQLNIPVDMLLTTSILRNPVSADDYVDDVIQPLQTVSLATLEDALPEILPIVPNAGGPWLTN